MILLVKAAREMAHTAKLREGVRFYLAPVSVGTVTTYGLITAFFDDSDEPLIICTTLFDEEIAREFLSLLSSDSFHVHFFDERNRELLGFRAETPHAHRFRAFADRIQFVAHPSLTVATFATRCNSGSVLARLRTTPPLQPSRCGNRCFPTA